MTRAFLSPASISGTLVINTTGSSQALQLVGYANRGGTGYHDFLIATNTYSGATNPSKNFRISSAGELQIINDAYNSNIFNLTDDGILTVPKISAGGSTGTSGQVLQSTGSGLQWASLGGSGTVTSITAGTGLTGGTITSSGTLAIDTTVVPQLGAANSFTAQQTIAPTSTSVVPLTVNAPASTTSDVLNVNINGTKYLWVDKYGNTFQGSGTIGNATALGARLGIYTNGPSVVGMIVKGAPSQTSDLVQYQNSSGTTLAKIDYLGNLTATKFVTTSGTSSQFVKGDGSLDSSTYLTTGTAASTYSPIAGSTSLVTTGTVTTGTWSGLFGSVSGANLTNLTAGNLTGTIPSTVLGNSTNYIGTTAIALNRASGSQTLTGISIDGNAATATKLQTARLINSVSFDGSADITIKAVNPNALTIGTGLSGSSYDGSGAVTVAIDSTVATLTGVQTLTNKTLTVPVIDNINAVSATGTTATLFPNVTTGALAIGAGITTGTVNIAAVGTGANTINIGNTNSTVTINGNLTVTGTTETINSSTLLVQDKNIEIGKVATPSDSTANGGGMLLYGTTNKTLQWQSSTSSWLSSEHFDLASGKTYHIAGTTVLTPTQVLGRTPGGTTAGDIATIDATQTLTNKAISGSSNTLTNIANSSLTNSSITLGTTSVSLGGTTLTLSGLTSVTATSHITSGGTSSQFVKGDGSLDSSTYLTTGTAASTYSPIAGSSSITTLGTITSGSFPAANIAAGSLSTGVVPTAASVTSAASGLGYTGMPQNLQPVVGSTYTLIASDAGKHIYFNANCTLTVPANASVAFPVGTSIALVAASGVTVTVSITSDTLMQAGTGATGSRTLAPYGMATLLKVAATTWMISGNGLT